MSRTGRALTRLALCLLATFAASGCSVSVRTFGAASVADLQAEANYDNIYSVQVTHLHTDLQRLLAPSGSANPGVCNAGGDKQGCYDADVTLIADLQAMAQALTATKVPPRYVDPDRLLQAALAENVHGLQLRNDAIANNDEAAWTQHQVVLAQAATDMQQAYLAFPADDRPQPAP